MVDELRTLPRCPVIATVGLLSLSVMAVHPIFLSELRSINFGLLPNPMFIERKVNQATNKVELWECEWEYPEGAPAKKIFVSRIGEEQPLAPEGKNSWSQVNAICWASGRTLGNIAVFSKSIFGNFPAQAGDDALLPCDFVHAGKFRHGADRWWCRTHQTHWELKLIKNHISNRE